jgi:hypothetical protein
MDIGSVWNARRTELMRERRSLYKQYEHHTQDVPDPELKQVFVVRAVVLELIIGMEPGVCSAAESTMLLA